jgi:hypothetical protein
MVFKAEICRFSSFFIFLNNKKPGKRGFRKNIKNVSYYWPRPCFSTCQTCSMSQHCCCIYVLECNINVATMIQLRHWASLTCRKTRPKTRRNLRDAQYTTYMMHDGDNLWLFCENGNGNATRCGVILIAGARPRTTIENEGKDKLSSTSKNLVLVISIIWIRKQLFLRAYKMQRTKPSKLQPL